MLLNKYSLRGMNTPILPDYNNPLETAGCKFTGLKIIFSFFNLHKPGTKTSFKSQDKAHSRLLTKLLLSPNDLKCQLYLKKEMMV